jgi:hypothetical protein
MSRAREEAPPPEPEPDAPQDDEPPADVPDEEPRITGAQRAMLHALFRSQGMDQNAYREYTRKTLGRELDTTNELTVTEASFMIDHMQELAGETDGNEAASH